MDYRARSRPFIVKDLNLFFAFLMEMRELLEDYDRDLIPEVMILDQNARSVCIGCYRAWPVEDLDFNESPELEGFDFLDRLKDHIEEGQCAVLETFGEEYYALTVVTCEGVKLDKSNKDYVLEAVIEFGGDQSHNTYE